MADDEWLSVSALARALGRDKAGVSRRVARFEEQSLLATRIGKSGVKLVNRGDFDRVAAETVDAVQEANGLKAHAARDHEGAASAGPVGASPGLLSRAQASKTAAQAKLAHLDLDERLGRLLPLERVQEATRASAERLRRAVDTMPSRAEEVASGLAQASPFASALLAALRSDPQGARAFFKAMAREQLSAMAKLSTAFDTADV